MNIRSITVFMQPGWPVEPRLLEAIAPALSLARQALESADYPVQTLRLATPPPTEMERPVPPKDRPELARQLEAQAFVHGIDYVAIGPALPEEAGAISVVPDILAATENVFTSAIYADATIGISLPAARGCADATLRNATISPDGFANLRFAALANVPAGTPFFPAAYHAGGPPALAIATEAAELAVDAFRDVSSPSTARRRLVGMVEAHAAAIQRTLQPILAEHEIRWLGIDFSLAPFPEHHRSIGTALELLGAPMVGLSGTTAAAAFLTYCLDSAQFKRTGFCGLFMPVLEDTVLAQRAAEGHLTLDDLLLLATVCGTGLDTIPLAGDVSPEALTAVLADLGALALRHNKPLTARLMPLPGKAPGDEVHFDFPYFADSRVLPLLAQPTSGLLASSGVIHVGPRLS
jgi:uncharacterized protein (UPF0210 family)